MQDGLSLKFVDNDLPSYLAIACKAVTQNPKSLTFVPEEMKKDVILQSIRESRRASIFESLPEELRADREVVLEAVRLDGDCLQYASKELRDDREVVLAAVESKGSALQYASKNIQNDTTRGNNVAENMWSSNIVYLAYKQSLHMPMPDITLTNETAQIARDTALNQIHQRNNPGRDEFGFLGDERPSFDDDAFLGEPARRGFRRGFGFGRR